MISVQSRYRYLYKPAVFLASITPAVLLAAGAFGVLGQDLGPDPVARLLHTCGKTTLNFILITLAITPVSQLTGWRDLVRVRRMLGLFAFFYACCHFFVYLVLDQELNVRGVVADIAKRPYITIGFTALVLLIPLAVTSTNRMMRRLGKRWKRLHRLIYVVAVLGVWHYYWQVKRDIRLPLLYIAMLAVLLGYRVVRGYRARRALTSRSGSATAPERI